MAYLLCSAQERNIFLLPAVWIRNMGQESSVFLSVFSENALSTFRKTLSTLEKTLSTLDFPVSTFVCMGHRTM